MMLAIMLMAAAEPETAVDAERAFYRSAQTEGQWTAFRKFSTPDAVVFVPQPAKAADVLPKKNPVLAIHWWPAESYVSCDGTVAVNTGPWLQPKSAGYFTTVWERQADGHYKWSMDGGDELATPRGLPEQVRVRRAACRFPKGKSVAITFEPGEGTRGQGVSADGTLAWQWRVKPDGSRLFLAKLWNGRTLETVVRNEIAAPPPAPAKP